MELWLLLIPGDEPATDKRRMTKHPRAETLASTRTDRDSTTSVRNKTTLNNNLLPRNIWEMFAERDGGYNLRGTLIHLLFLLKKKKKKRVQRAMKNSAYEAVGGGELMEQ